MADQIVANQTTTSSRSDSADALVLAGVTKSFGAIQALRGIDLTIKVGETVALLGPNGAGKSTTLDVVLGLARPDAGTALVMGLNPTDAVQAGRVGGMLQTGTLIQHLKVRELLLMVASLYPKPRSIDEVMELTGITELAGRDTARLSGGQTQRVRFAVALIGDPDLLVLDEPTAALDVEARREFWTVMRGVAGTGRTVIFATHNLEEADAYADRVLLLAEGRLVADGTANEIRAQVGGRRIRATLPVVEIGELQDLPGVAGVERRGEAVVMNCTDSDLALRALLDRYRQASDIEVTSAGLEEAFIELTASNSHEGR